MEAIFRRLKGVVSVEPGYSGGTTENPTYEQVCSGKTRHAEAIKIKFDPKMNYSAVNCGVSLRESSFRTIHPQSYAARYSGSKIKKLMEDFKTDVILV